jgi:hypothetical protein
MKRKQEWDKAGGSNHLKNLLMKRRGSGGSAEGSSDEEEDEIEDMGLFGKKLV